MSLSSTLPRLGFTGSVRHRIVWGIRLGGLAAIAGWALATPGIISLPSFFALLNSISFIGCVAVGMTFITLTGNIMSLALGATASACALVFLPTLALGVWPAFVLAIVFGAVLTALQGAVIGWLRANPILVSIAALALMLGTAQIVTNGQSVYPAAPGSEIFKARLFGLPVTALFFFAIVLIGQIFLSFTRYGLAMIIIGSNVRAAEAAGFHTGRIATVAYLLAGAFSAVSGVMLSARYGSADMELAGGYDYSAIAAVLVGGTAIEGGSGSIVRTLIGVTIIALVEVVLILRGFSDQTQYFITGLIVLAVILLHAMGERD
jgi:ribose/xylose/arabinose/galactoside ABC-type transport system permease subunit